MSVWLACAAKHGDANMKRRPHASGRGLGKATKDGSVEIIAHDYPWAEDGKLIWDALHGYIRDYVVRARRHTAAVPSAAPQGDQPAHFPPRGTAATS